MYLLVNLIQKINILTLINFSNEVNTMTSIYIVKLGFKIWKTNINTQKIDSSTFQTFKIVLASF